MANERSVSYPSTTLNDSLDLVKQIYENFGTAIYAPREDIAKMLNRAEPTVQQPVSTAKQYGLLEMKSGQGYKPSDLFFKIHKPLSEQEKAEALTKAFSTPDLYATLIAEFNNNILPAVEPLSNVLLRKYGVKGEGLAKKIATLFSENARNLNLLNSENILKMDSSVKSETPNEPEKVEAEVVHQNNGAPFTPAITINTKPENDKPPYTPPSIDKGVNAFNIPLKTRKRAQLLIPDDIQREDFDTIIKWVYLMKESFE